MKIDIVNNQRVITPENGMWLYNAKVQVISDLVYLGIEADATEWIEITAEQKQELENIWNEEAIDENIATEEDYQNALESLGVKFDE